MGEDISGAASTTAVDGRVRSQRNIDLSDRSASNELGEMQSRIFVCRPKDDSLHCWPGWMTFANPGFEEIMGP